MTSPSTSVADTTLIVTVGRSPDPLLLAIQQLRPTKVIWIGSKDTRATCDRVVTGLADLANDANELPYITTEPFVEVDAFDPASSVQAIVGIPDLPADADIFYSGGTGAMAVGTVLAWSQRSTGIAWYRSRAGELCGIRAGDLTSVEASGGRHVTTWGWPVHSALHLSLPDPGEHYGFTCAESFTIGARLADAPWWGDDANVGEIGRLIGELEQHPRRFDRPDAIERGRVTLRTVAGIPNSRFVANTVSKHELRRNLKGLALECAMVAAVGRRLDYLCRGRGPGTPDVKLDYSVMWRKTNSHGFNSNSAEVDITIRCGPILTVISVGSGPENACVKKIHEVKDRALLFGGSEARSLALVHCPYDGASTNGFYGLTIRNIRIKGAVGEDRNRQFAIGVGGPNGPLDWDLRCNTAHGRTVRTSFRDMPNDALGRQAAAALMRTTFPNSDELLQWLKGSVVAP